MRKLLLVICLGIATVAMGQHFKLVVAGDGRADPLAKPARAEDVNGINVLIQKEICQAVLDEGAKAMLWTGDLVLGAKDAAQHKSQLEDWVKIMQPLWDHGVQVLPVRGNHEANSNDSERVWNEVFTGAHALPQTGPAEAKNLTYWVEIENTLILGLDHYVYGPELSPTRWIAQTLADHKKAHTFAFGHEMAFMAGRHKDNLSVNGRNRDDLVNLLIRAGSKAYFAGHDHFYDHLVAKDDKGAELHQFVAGTAGAPLYADLGYIQDNPGWTTTRVLHLPKEKDGPIVYGYMVIEIDGPKATITFKGRTGPGKYEPMDSWGY